MTPHDLLPAAIETLPEIADARRRYESADAELEAHLLVPTFLRGSRSARRHTTRLVAARNTAYLDEQHAYHRVWTMIPHTITDDCVCIPQITA